MELKQKIEGLINKTNKIDNDQYMESSFICIYEFKWSYQELMNTPIPFVLTILNKWSSMKKEEKKAMKKRR